MNKTSKGNALLGKRYQYLIKYLMLNIKRIAYIMSIALLLCAPPALSAEKKTVTEKASDDSGSIHDKASKDFKE